MAAGLLSLFALVGLSFQASNDTAPESRRDGWGMAFQISYTTQISSSMENNLGYRSVTRLGSSAPQS